MADEVKIAKQLDEDERLFTAIVLRPNETDAHGDIYDEATVQKACHDFTEFCRQGNIQHMVETPTVAFVESHIAKADYDLGSGKVLAGDWIMTARIDDDTLWEACKDGTFTGFSVGCTASVINMQQDDD